MAKMSHCRSAVHYRNLQVTVGLPCLAPGEGVGSTPWSQFLCVAVSFRFMENSSCCLCPDSTRWLRMVAASHVLSEHLSPPWYKAFCLAWVFFVTASPSRPNDVLVFTWPLVGSGPFSPGCSRCRCFSMFLFPCALSLFARIKPTIMFYWNVRPYCSYYHRHTMDQALF